MEQEVLELIDSLVTDLSKEEYHIFLGDLIGDLDTRREAVEMEMEDE